MRRALAPLLSRFFFPESLQIAGHELLCLFSVAIRHATTAAAANSSPEGPGSARASGPKGPITKQPTPPSHRELLATSNRCTDGLIPVGKLLALRGFCSRGEGDEFFSLGLVLLDGRRLERNEAYVHPGAPVRLAPRAERLMQQKVTVLLHKPMHFLACQTDKQARGGGGKPLSISLLCPENHWTYSGRCGVLDPRHFKKLVAAGRLDADSSGLQVFTQDGRIAAQLLGGTAESIAKEYVVQADVPLSEGARTLLQSGLSLDGCELLPAVVRPLSSETALQLLNGTNSEYEMRSPSPESLLQRSVFFSIELREGRNRQIRRMCELVGLRALRIHRVRIGSVQLGSLPPGHWRYLQRGESFS